MKRILLPLLIFFSSLCFGQTSLTELECSGLGKIGITKERNYQKSEQINSGKYSYYVTVKNDSMSINDTVLKNIPQKFRRDNGYEEYGGFVTKDSEYQGYYFYQRGESHEHQYLLSHYDLRLYRLSGEFYFHKTFYINNIKDTDYKSYNKHNLKDGYVNLEVVGTCKKTIGKQKF